MPNDKKIKILITYKKKQKILQSNILTPIQTGRAISDEIFEEMIGDDTGENISELNNEFCELTAIYWAWKNYDKIDNPDYIGFMHYRRILMFNEKKNDLSDKDVAETIDGYDVVTHRSPGSDVNMYEQYKQNLFIKDYDNALKILKEKYPDDAKYADEYNNQYIGRFYNIFVFKKEIFFEYCNWLFDILFATRERIDTTNYNSEEMRQIGFIAERLTAIYLTKLFADKQIKTKETPLIFVNNPPNTSPIKDYFSFIRYSLIAKFSNKEKSKYYNTKAKNIYFRMKNPNQNIM